MVRVLIAVADIGSGVQLEAALGAAGLEVRWDASMAAGPTGSATHDVVLLDEDHLGPKLAAVVAQWRQHASVPGLVAVGGSPAARDHAARARVPLVAASAPTATLHAAIREAARLRLSGGIGWAVMRAALGLPPADNTVEAWPATLLHARNANLELAREALRPHASHYVTHTPRFEELREERILSVPELETASRFDGTRPVRSLLPLGPLDPAQTARLIWALAALGAVTLTEEVADLATPGRRALAELRAHLRARVKRLERGTVFDVLEVSPLAGPEEVDYAYRLLAARYSPKAMSRFDLAELASQVQPVWDQIEQARATLLDIATLGRYTDWLRQNRASLTTTWALAPEAISDAAEAFARGLQLLAQGDAQRAMNELAKACRSHPGHPDYEANLAWARFRVQVAAGRPAQETALAERRAAEEELAGRRPWPRSLVALALLCAASSDADAARWHLHVALQIDPSLPAAVQLAQRLGVRR